jgi:hypothetical protein
MFCPLCESEYEPGIERFVPLHTLGAPAEAEMVNDILAQNGIRTAVQSSNLDAFSPLLATTTGSVVLVDERDYDRAQEIYNAFFGNDTTPLTGTTLEEEDDDAETSQDR